LPVKRPGDIDRRSETRVERTPPFTKKYMTKRNSIQQASPRYLAMIATAAAALLATSPFAAAKKPDPAILTAVNNAQLADIEEVVKIGIQAGDQIGTGQIKFNTNNVITLVRGLADAIIAKTPTGQTPEPVNIDNKIDEIGEVAAFVFHSVSQSVKIKTTKKGLKQAKKYAVATMKSALKSAIKTSEFLGTDIITDVVGSVALTIHNDPKFELYESKLQKQLIKSAKAIAGRTNKTTVINALNAGFLGDAAANSAFEDGTLAELAQVSDPETDFRNA
jgi:hypothetical protein